MAHAESGRPAQEISATRRDEDWSRDDLTGQTFAGLELVGTDLAETVSTAGLVFDGCVLRDVDFSLAEHTGAAFLNCRFVGCRLFGARFTECKFVGAVFDGTTFDQMVVAGGDWSFTLLRGADLHSARFEDVRMREADLSDVNLRGATVRRVDLANAIFDRAALDRCDLRGSDLTSLDPTAVALDSAVITWEQAIPIASALGFDVRAE